MSELGRRGGKIAGKKQMDTLTQARPTADTRD
jgi:hypothetical protein